MTNWSTDPLKNLTTKIGSGATPKGGKKSYKDEGISLIRSQNVYNLKFERDGLAFIDEDQAENLSHVQVEGKDVLLNITGHSVGRCCMVPDRILPARVNQHVMILRADPSRIDPRYLLYYVNSPDVKRGLLQRTHGATRDALTKGQMEAFEVKYPPLSVQRRIADILGALDDKIELNRRMNETLEAMAQALYRHWFVDFGPFQDREFTDTEELGPIPKGWEVKPIKEVVDMLGGSTPKTKVDEYWDGGNITWFTPTDLTDQDQLFLEHSDRQITEEGLNSCSTNIFPPYSIMMTSRATVGVTAINRVEACTNQGFINIIPGDEVSLPQVYFWIDRMMHKIEARADGSTYPEISQRDFKPLPILVAPSEDVEEYVRQSKELFSLIENNIVESETLAETRDYFLPKLISGEIEVDAAQEIAEDTVDAPA